MAGSLCNSTALVYRLHDSAPDVVRKVLLERGWEEYNPQEQEEGDWNLYWRASAFPSLNYQNILPWQRLNHHPNTAIATRKDYLARDLRRMRNVYGPGAFGFSPTTFILPNEYTKFLEAYAKTQLENGGKSGCWICKPVSLSRGRGIFIFDDLKHLSYDSPVIVQKYVSNPLLISGYKFDLRLYVCVTSFSPLTIYMHQEGLVRFATEKYNLSSLGNLFSHLTNTSINKFGPFYTMAKERVGQGCKWTLSNFRSFLQNQGINELLLWQKINSIVTLTLLTIAPSVPSNSNCLELFGFDILIDSCFKPWLLEVNYSPALSLDCPVDVRVKEGLIHDLIDLMNYSKIDSLRCRGYFRQRCKHLCQLANQSLLSTTHPMLLLSNSGCDNKRQSKSSLNLLRIENLECTSMERSAESCLHSKTVTVNGIKKTKGSFHLENLAEAEWNDGGLALMNSYRKTARRSPAANSCKLPAIHAPKYKPLRFSMSQRPQKSVRSVPSFRVGDFILTFPFNEVTQKASQDTLDVKTIVHEVLKLRNQLAFSCTCKEMRGLEKNECSAALKNTFVPLLWGPRNPPLLSEYCTST